MMVWPPLTGLDNNLCAQRIGQPRSFHADADPDDPLRMLFAPGRSLGVVGDAQQKNSGRLTRSAARWKLLKLELYEALPAGATDAGLLDALAAVGIDSSLPESVECIGEKEFVAIVGELRARHAGTWVGQWATLATPERNLHVRSAAQQLGAGAVRSLRWHAEAQQLAVWQVRSLRWHAEAQHLPVWPVRSLSWRAEAQSLAAWPVRSLSWRAEVQLLAAWPVRSLRWRAEAQ